MMKRALLTRYPMGYRSSLHLPAVHLLPVQGLVTKPAWSPSRPTTARLASAAPSTWRMTPIRGYWGGKQSPYDILHVSRSADAKEIKMAFYREAKKYHPDLHPDDPKAKSRFQEIAAAYELLSDPSRKRAYDTTGYSDTGTSGGSGAGFSQQSGYSQAHAEEIFNTVSADFDVIREALASYREEIADEMHYILSTIERRDWPEVWEIAKNHKFIILGIAVPSFLLLRYPPLVLAAIRLAWLGGQMIVAGLLYTGNFQLAARMLWKLIVGLSLEQKKRRDGQDKKRK